MKAAVFQGTKKPLVVQDVPDPVCAPNGALIRVEANGVCRSDWHAWSGDWHWMGLVAQPGQVLGHELCGVVEEVGKDVKSFKKGDRVVVPFSQGDGTCDYCRNGQSNVCDTPLTPGFSYSGGFGRMVPVPFADLNLVALPKNVDFIEAASMGCRFMTSFHGIVDRAQVKPGEWVAVYGCGGIGLSAINVVRRRWVLTSSASIPIRPSSNLPKAWARHMSSTARRPTRLPGGGTHQRRRACFG